MRESGNVMGIHVSDTHSFIDLYWPLRAQLDGLQGQTAIQDIFFHSLLHRVSWKTDTFSNIIDSNLINKLLMG